MHLLAHSSGGIQPVGWGNLPQEGVIPTSALLLQLCCHHSNAPEGTPPDVAASPTRILRLIERCWWTSRVSAQGLSLLLTCMSANFRSVLTSSSSRIYYYRLPTNTQNSLQFKSFKHGNSNNDILIASAALKFVEIWYLPLANIGGIIFFLIKLLL